MVLLAVSEEAMEAPQEAPGYLQIPPGLDQLCCIPVAGVKPLIVFEFLPSVDGFTPLEPSIMQGQGRGRKTERHHQCIPSVLTC